MYTISIQVTHTQITVWNILTIRTDPCAPSQSIRAISLPKIVLDL